MRHAWPRACGACSRLGPPAGRGAQCGTPAAAWLQLELCAAMVGDLHTLFPSGYQAVRPRRGSHGQRWRPVGLSVSTLASILATFCVRRPMSHRHLAWTRRSAAGSSACASRSGRSFANERNSRESSGPPFYPPQVEAEVLQVACVSCGFAAA